MPEQTSNVTVYLKQHIPPSVRAVRKLSNCC